MQDKFFGSKLNTVLLFVLIILVVGAIYIMLQNKETYLNIFEKQVPVENVIDKTQEPLIIKDGILGNKDDLISFSVLPYTKVHGILSYRGIIKGGYFFEGNILVSVTYADKKIVVQNPVKATTDWMTSGPVSFEGSFNFTGLNKGPAYIQIHNDNASGLLENDKFILIPIIIE